MWRVWVCTVEWGGKVWGVVGLYCWVGVEGLGGGRGVLLGGGGRSGVW